MVALNLGINKDQSDSTNKNDYENWIKFRKDTEKNYILVPNEIKDYLPHIHTQAINLYLYYFFRSKNKTGISWPSVERVAKDLDVSTRSVNYWNKELEDIGLIARINENRSSITTYLLPISNFYYLEKKDSIPLIQEKNVEKLSGKLTNIFHIFQWRKNIKTSEYTDKLNMIFLVYKRTGLSKDQKKVKEVFKIVGIEPNDEDIKKISIVLTSNNFKKDVYRINDCNLTNLPDIPTRSLAISTKLNLLGTEKETNKEILLLLEDLISNFNSIDELDPVNGSNE